MSNSDVKTIADRIGQLPVSGSSAVRDSDLDTLVAAIDSVRGRLVDHASTETLPNDMVTEEATHGRSG